MSLSAARAQLWAAQEELKEYVRGRGKGRVSPPDIHCLPLQRMLARLFSYQLHYQESGGTIEPEHMVVRQGRSYILSDEGIRRIETTIGFSQ